MAKRESELILRPAETILGPDDVPAREPEPPREHRDGHEDERHRPWTESDFNPFGPTNGERFFFDGGVTYKTGTNMIVCEFVAEPVGEIVTILRLDQPEHRERRLVVRYTLPSGHQQTITLDPASASGDIVSALLRGVPSDLARASVVSRRDVALATLSFKSSSFETIVRVRQCGWLPDGTFALPGTDDVDLAHVEELAGARLWEIPQVANPVAAREGAAALLQVCASAPSEVIAPVVGVLFAAPIFREEGHLAARGFTTVVVGPSQRGKTTLVRSACCLLGRFDRQPGCVSTWLSTFASLERALHAYRDLPVFVDDFRETDGEARDTFRRLVLALGDGIGRGRTASSASGARVARAFTPVALLLATGEQSVDDDAAIAGRVVEVAAEGIDVAQLLQILPAQRQAMPHVYAEYLAFLPTLPAHYWSAKREAMRELALAFGSSESRAGENLATIVIALQIATDFFDAALPGEIAMGWRNFVESFQLRLPEMMSRHARRIRDDAIDEVVLTEVARGVRAGEIRLAHLPSRHVAPPDAKGHLVGAYDVEKLYLQPDILTRWVSDQLLRARRRRAPVGRKTLSRAFAARDGLEGDIRVQRTLEGRVTWLWCISRARLGDAWLDLLEDAL